MSDPLDLPGWVAQIASLPGPLLVLAGALLGGVAAAIVSAGFNLRGVRLTARSQEYLADERQRHEIRLRAWEERKLLYLQAWALLTEVQAEYPSLTFAGHQASWTRPEEERDKRFNKYHKKKVASDSKIDAKLRTLDPLFVIFGSPAAAKALTTGANKYVEAGNDVFHYVLELINYGYDKEAKEKFRYHLDRESDKIKAAEEAIQEFRQLMRRDLGNEDEEEV